MSRQLAPLPLILAGAGVNAAHTIQAGKDPFPGLMGGAVFGTIAVGINTVTKTRIGTMMGALFLLSSFLFHGVQLIDIANGVISSPKAPLQPLVSSPIGSPNGPDF